jgi:hypothetical protein
MMIIFFITFIFLATIESRDANKILTSSIKSELNENANKDSTINLFYSKDVENMIPKDIDEITIENNTTTHTKT